ncbi:MAG: lysylphosphatidylglycerol synthase transmembrane domain-containing protein [Planctomycetia bacterium]|nr:lysylphosphatidylglycerol synthase transmembrane domain-containing protein [Planctomycetia bacterium]
MNNRSIGKSMVGDWRFWGKLVVMLLIVVGLALAVRKSLIRLEETDISWSLRPWTLLIATLVYTLALFPSGLFYRAGMRAMGQNPPFLRTIRAYYIGHLGKYVPGKAMVPILRAGLVHGPEVSVAAAVAGVFLETLTWISTGAFLGVICLACGHHDIWAKNPWLMGSAVVIACATILPTLPPIFRFAVSVLEKIFPHKAGTLRELNRLGFRTLLFGWLCSCVVWWGMGISFWLVLRSIHIGEVEYFDVSTIPFCTMTIALAVSVSFLILPLPGGLGVRELVIGTLVVGVFFASVHDQSVPKAIAALSAVLFRLISLAGETGASLFLLPLRGRGPVSPGEPSEP